MSSNRRRLRISFRQCGAALRSQSRRSPHPTRCANTSHPRAAAMCARHSMRLRCSPRRRLTGRLRWRTPRRRHSVRICATTATATSIMIFCPRLQKSIRGSDPDAAVHYLARLLASGDLISACRQTHGHCGGGYWSGISAGDCRLSRRAWTCANQLGLPEARIPLADAAILLATVSQIQQRHHERLTRRWRTFTPENPGDVPAHLKDSHYAGAKQARARC